MAATLNSGITLPCGLTIPNRLGKSAMTEGLADASNRATEAHEKLYRIWSEGGSGLLITGNVQINRRNLEAAGNVVVEGTPDELHLEKLRAWSAAAQSNGAKVFMQISHAGRQTPKAVNPTPEAPSAIPLNIPFSQYGNPVAMSEDDIERAIKGYVNLAKVAQDTGFDGVQLHAAHGYLVAQFLSPIANQRSDKWGGSLENRSRLLIETVKAMRAAVGPNFALSVKLNSSDFQRGGYTIEECLQVIRWLDEIGLDLLEISGGSYEAPAMAGVKGDEPSKNDNLQSDPTGKEAYFLDYAMKVREVTRTPIMLTGGIRSKQAMEAVLSSGASDIIGLAKPLVLEPDLPKRILNGDSSRSVLEDDKVRLGPGFLSPSSPFKSIRAINGLGSMSWFVNAIPGLAHGKIPDRAPSIVSALPVFMFRQAKKAKQLKRPL